MGIEWEPNVWSCCRRIPPWGGGWLSRSAGVWQAMNLDDVLDEERRDILRRNGFSGGNEVRHLGKAIDDHENRVVVVSRRQVSYPIEGYTAPRSDRDREG